MHEQEQDDTRWQKFGALITKVQNDLRPKPSDRQVAKVAKITATHYGDLKKGLSGTKPPVVIRIANALDADPNAFLRAAGFSAEELSTRDMKLAARLGSILRKAPDEKRLELEDALEQMAEVLVKASK